MSGTELNSKNPLPGPDIQYNIGQGDDGTRLVVAFVAVTPIGTLTFLIDPSQAEILFNLGLKVAQLSKAGLRMSTDGY